jgi:hypothetical protein
VADGPAGAGEYDIVGGQVTSRRSMGATACRAIDRCATVAAVTRQQASAVGAPPLRVAVTTVVTLGSIPIDSFRSG